MYRFGFGGLYLLQLASAKCSEHTIKENMLLLERQVVLGRWRGRKRICIVLKDSVDMSWL